MRAANCARRTELRRVKVVDLEEHVSYREVDGTISDIHAVSLT